MQTVLLVLSTTRESPKTVAYALRRTKELGGKLAILCVIDTQLPSSIQEKLADSGFVGDKPGQEVYAQILKEYKQRGEKKLSEVLETARKEGLQVQASLREGDLVEECLTAIDQENASVVIIGRKKMSKLSQFIFEFRGGSPIKLLEKNAKCPVEVIEE